MTTWKKYFKLNGGGSLLKRYLWQRTLLVALNQFVVIGRDKKALEILRLSVSHKFYKRIKKQTSKYIKEIQDYVNTHQASLSSNEPQNKVWICWWQGIENAPEVVKKCYHSITHYLKEWDIIVITKDNYQNYVNFPAYIIEKWNKGIISNTHMSDLLRLELLINHGGLWLDSTILCTSGNIPQSIINSDLFFYQCLKPGADGEVLTNSNWLIYAKKGHPILLATLWLLYKYWKDNNKIIDYFIFHYYLTAACEMYPKEYYKIPQYSNSIPHILLLNLFNKFNLTYWQDLCDLTCFHKLSYKLDKNLIEHSKDTYYNYIMSLNNEK